MTSQAWGSPESGVFVLRYAGHDLELRRTPKMGKNNPDRPYQVFVDGVLTDMAWSTTDGKTKAIKTAERSHKGQPIISYDEKVNGTASPSIRDPEPKEEPKPQAKPADVQAIDKPPAETLAQHEPPARIAPGSLSSLIAGFQGDGAGVAELLKPISASVDRLESADAAGVSFTIRGTMDTTDATDALNTIRAAVELLREHGLVSCDAVVPSRIKL